MTELEKLRAGLPYHYDDPDLVAMKDTASLRCHALNSVDPLDAAGREAAARELLGHAGPELDIQPGFHCDNGKNISVGRRFTANFNVTILDGAPVTFGDFCMVGPARSSRPPGTRLRRRGAARDWLSADPSQSATTCGSAATAPFWAASPSATTSSWRLAPW